MLVCQTVYVPHCTSLERGPITCMSYPSVCLKGSGRGTRRWFGVWGIQEGVGDLEGRSGAWEGVRGFRRKSGVWKGVGDL